ncbi:recombinase family protein [Bradyrhizobium elkanii]|uniref:recombinase family protein n=2 Tax=Nitrobacteraceae TaxID=41294 RepID=UPI0027154A6F|nr:recombinase family protein [Bradyrhizobium elkanii]WLB05030.1 recombinase family protein [Bradyrhizobium elkanii]
MSTDAQLQGDSLRRQLDASRAYAERHGLQLTELKDMGVSGYRGANIASGALGVFLAAIRDGEVPRGSYLLVESIDRLSRQAPAKALQPFLEVINAGIVLVTLNPLEVFTEDNLDFYRLLMALTIMQRSHEESDVKSHRLKSAWAAKRTSAGQKKLTARCPSWLRLSSDRSRFEIVEDRAAIVRRIFDEAANGYGTYTIVRRLNADGIPTFMGKGGWQTSTVNKILSSPAAAGTFQPNRIEGGQRLPEGQSIRGYFPQIVRQEVFESAQRGRLERKTTPNKETGKKGSGGPKGKHFANLFSKLAVCDYCAEPMHYQNKGQPPKGRSYLVCSNAIRKKGCEMTGRWRYDQFELTFLSFVEQLDLASLVSSSEHSSKRNEVAFQLDAAVGRIKLLEDEQRRAYEIGLKMADFDSAFIADRIKKTERDLADATKVAEQLRHEISILDQTALTYYRSPDQVAELIERVRAARGGDVYKLRAQIASRLQSLIGELRLTVDPDTQRFEVVFRDGQGMTLFVDPEEPTKFVQKVSGKAPDFDVLSADGSVVQLPADEPALDGK